MELGDARHAPGRAGPADDGDDLRPQRHERRDGRRSTTTPSSPCRAAPTSSSPTPSSRPPRTRRTCSAPPPPSRPRGSRSRQNTLRRLLHRRSTRSSPRREVRPGLRHPREAPAPAQPRPHRPDAASEGTAVRIDSHVPTSAIQSIVAAGCRRTCRCRAAADRRPRGAGRAVTARRASRTRRATPGGSPAFFDTLLPYLNALRYRPRAWRRSPAGRSS